MSKAKFDLNENDLVILYFRIPEYIDDELADTLISTLSFKEQIRLKSIQNRKAQNRSLLGKIMLNHVRVELGIQESAFHYDLLSGKPYFDSHVGVGFNISHSGDITACCFTKYAESGIDLEQNRKVSIENFKHIFHSDEWHYIINSEDPGESFLRLWVRKEAVTKANGRGMEMDLSSFNSLGSSVTIGLNTWFVQDVFIDLEYKCAVACKQKKDFNLVNFNEIFNPKNNFSKLKSEL